MILFYALAAAGVSFIILIVSHLLGKKDQEQQELIKNLQNALKEIKTLQGILPICSFCKKIRDDKGYWSQVDAYVSQHTDATFSHGVCPECIEKHYLNNQDEDKE